MQQPEDVQKPSRYHQRKSDDPRFQQKMEALSSAFVPVVFLRDISDESDSKGKTIYVSSEDEDEDEDSMCGIETVDVSSSSAETVRVARFKDSTQTKMEELKKKTEEQQKQYEEQLEKLQKQYEEQQKQYEEQQKRYEFLQKRNEFLHHLSRALEEEARYAEEINGLKKELALVQEQKRYEFLQKRNEFLHHLSRALEEEEARYAEEINGLKKELALVQEKAKQSNDALLQQLTLAEEKQKIYDVMKEVVEQLQSNTLQPEELEEEATHPFDNFEEDRLNFEEIDKEGHMEGSMPVMEVFEKTASSNS